jgi:hypothetical protein
LPPVLDALKDWPGNHGDIVSYFLHPDQSLKPQLGIGPGGRLLAAEFAPLPAWLGGHDDIGFGGLADGRSLALLLVPAVLIVVGIVVARRRGDWPTMRFLVLVAALAAAGWFALSRIEGETIPYLFWWRTVIAIAIVLGAGWALLAGSQLARRMSPVAGPVLAVLVVAWGSGHYAIDVAHAADHDSPQERATASISRELLKEGIPAGGVILRLQEGSFTQLQRGIYDELARHSDEVFVDENVDYQYRDGRAAAPSSVERVWWVAESGAALAELMSKPGARLVASWSPLSPKVERRARELTARLRDQFHEIDRADLDQQLDTIFLTLVTKGVDGVDHAAAHELTAINAEVAKRGGSRSAVVAFTPADAPARLSLDP